MDELGFDRRAFYKDQIKVAGWIRSQDWLLETESTNSLQKQAAIEEKLPELPWLVVADHQTAGRGRSGNVWWSPTGCLMFSIALRLDAEQDRIGQLSLVIGLAIAKAIRRIAKHSNTVRVKWPNDVYVRDKKLAGILIENVTRGQDQFWIVGVGINVLVPIHDAPTAISSNATSLHLEVDPSLIGTIFCEAVLIELLNEIQGALAMWRITPEYLQENWSDFCFLSGKQLTISQPKNTIVGHCCGIDASGGLVVLDESGRKQTILSGAVEKWTSK